jgi:uncharacterized protein
MDFNPLPFKSAPWCINGHFHTIFSSILFSSPALDTESLTIDTPDGDFLTLDLTQNSPDSPVAVLFHGLEGHSRRYYITQLAEHLFKRGFTIVAVNFRSCSGKMNLNKKFYHSGETEDLETVFSWVRNQYPNNPVTAAGFSLGASALLNYLKANGTNHPLSSVVAISTPFDLKKGSHNLERGFNKIYSLRFLKTLVQKLYEKKKMHPDLPDFNGSTIYEFDDIVTAPIHGFSGADDYYYQCSSRYFTDSIKTPVMVLHSKEDPMCPFKWIPVADLKNNRAITTCFTDRGGHVGFWSLPPGWLNRTAGDYIAQSVRIMQG